MEIILAAVVGILIFLPLVLKLESWLNKGDDFDSVKEWHNFSSAMRKK
jgi:hypothetical protein